MKTDGSDRAMSVRRIRGFSAKDIPLLSLLVASVLVASAPRATAHQDPPGCSATGVGIALEGFRADRATPISLVDTVTECETICVRATVMHPDEQTARGLACGTRSV